MLLLAFLFALVTSLTSGPPYYNQPIFAKAAYSTPQEIRAWTCPICLQRQRLDNVIVFSNNGFQGYAGYLSSARQIIVAFRGSQTAEQFFANLDFTLVDYSPCKGCQVHAGMFRAWANLQGDTLNAIKKLKAIYREVDMLGCYGHSIGGAIATFAARDIQDIYSFSQNYLFTQGKPRIGNKLFADYMDTVVDINTRVVHWRDKVPHLPPQLLGYYHQGAEYWCNEEMSDCQTCYNEDSDCSNSFLVYTFQDHPMDSYFFKYD